MRGDPMKRFSSVILSILLGAIAVGGGMFVFLDKANADRARLADIAAKSREDAKAAQEASQKTVEDANRKLADANAEIAKAQNVIKSLEEERKLMRNAVILEPPRSNAVKGWKQAIDIPLGVSCKFPPGHVVELNDAQALTISTTEGTPDGRWLSITPYDERLDSELRANFTTSTAVSYLVGGRLLMGARGEKFFVLRVQKDGRTSHLIWARVSAGMTEKTVLTALATLDFAE